MNDDAVNTVKWIIESIPYGRVATYGQIAELAGLPRRARFVARILSDSDDSDALPWHRVVRADGRIAPRPGADKQATRLRRERVDVIDGRIDLKRYGWNDDLDMLME